MQLTARFRAANPNFPKDEVPSTEAMIHWALTRIEELELEMVHLHTRIESVIKIME